MEEFSGKKDDVQLILDEALNHFKLTEKELEFAREAFIVTLLIEIGEAAKEDLPEIPKLIQSLHQINQLDFHKIVLPLSPLERVLRKDPSGIYPKMTSETRAWYRNKIKIKAKKEIYVEF